MAKEYKSNRTWHNGGVYHFSALLSPADDTKCAFRNTVKNLFGIETDSITSLTNEQAETVFKHLRALYNNRDFIQTAPSVPLLSNEGEAASEPKMSPAQKGALIAIFNNRYDGKYDKIFAGLKKYAGDVLSRMKPADVKNTYLPAFFSEITYAEAHKLIQRFDAVKKGEKRNEQQS